MGVVPIFYTDPSGHRYVNFDNSAECPIEQCGLNPYQSENGQYQGEDLYETYSYEEVTMMQLFWLDTRGRDSALREGLYNELNYIARTEYDECGPWCSRYSDEGQLYFETGLDPEFLAGLGSSAAAMVTGIRPGDPSSSSTVHTAYIRPISPEELRKVGSPGEQAHVREIRGGRANAEALFNELTVGYTSESHYQGGIVVRGMPGNIYITYKASSSYRSRGVPGIDFNFPGEQFFKWKFYD